MTWKNIMEEGLRQWLNEVQESCEGHEETTRSIGQGNVSKKSRRIAGFNWQSSTTQTSWEANINNLRVNIGLNRLYIAQRFKITCNKSVDEMENKDYTRWECLKRDESQINFSIRKKRREEEGSSQS